MQNDLNINLEGIPEERWTDTEERCADCRKFYQDDKDEEQTVPLLLWRKEGKEMLRLCWSCAEKRMMTKGQFIGTLMPNFYVPPLLTPLYWRDEKSGRLPSAVRRYFDFCCGHAPDATAADMGVPPLTPYELKLLCDYCVYHIHAPCWDNNDYAEEEYFEELNLLRKRAKTLASLESIRRWNSECMELGIDPF